MKRGAGGKGRTGTGEEKTKGDDSRKRGRRGQWGKEERARSTKQHIIK